MKEGPRSLGPDELPKLSDCLDAAYGHRWEPGWLVRVHKHAYTRKNAPNLRVIFVDGKVVSHVGVIYRRLRVDSETLRLGLIGGVGTLPEFRGRGYATELMLDQQQLMKENDADAAVLWTGSPDFYRRVGWEQAGVCKRCVVSSAPKAPARVEFSSYAGQVDTIRQLERTDINIIARTRDETRLAADIKREQVTLGMQDGAAIVYAMADVHESEGKKIATVSECGGCDDGIAALAAFFFNAHFVAEVHFRTTTTDDRFHRLFESCGYREQFQVAGMWKVINPDTFFSKVRAARGIDALSPQAVSAEVPERERTTVIFGTVIDGRPSDAGDGVFPLDVYVGGLNFM